MYALVEARWGKHDSSFRVIGASAERTLVESWRDSRYSLDLKDRGNKNRPAKQLLIAFLVLVQPEEWAEDFPLDRLIENGFIPVSHNCYIVMDPSHEDIGPFMEATYQTLRIVLNGFCEQLAYVQMFGEKRQGVEL